MKKICMLLPILFAGLLLSAQQINDPNVEVRTATNFHGINVGSAFDVYLSQGSDEAVAVSAAESRHRDRIKVEVKDGILFIRYDADGMKNWGGGNKKLKAYISFKNLDDLHVSGACDVYISGVIKSDKLNISQSGASDLRGKLDVNKLTVDLSGASDMMVTGKAMQVSIEASGASDFKGYDLVTEICEAKASGASDIKVTVNKELSAQASGASDVRYKGDGSIREVKSSGSSSVSKG